MICLLFPSGPISNVNQKIVWRHALDDLSLTIMAAIRYLGDPITLAAFQALSDEQKNVCTVAGTLSGMIVEDGQTIAYANPLQIYEDSRWWMKKPSNPDWMLGVTDYTEAEFSENWMPPID